MNLAPEVIRFILGMALLIPLCIPLRYLNHSLKYLYSTLLGLILPIWVYGNSVYPIFL